MCGIAGVVHLAEALPAVSREPLERMAGALRHRGPDEFGLYRDARCGLAHARLSIIDLAAGQQPLSNEDGTLWVSFNGEIFNYLELREELVKLGHAFKTKSDTEVIVHAWEAWGEAAFERFNGQWAIALWDAREQKLILSRDRLGVRPLYWCEHQGKLLFASEVKALFAAEATLPRRLDPVGLKETFTFWTVVPPQTVFAGISELEPGHTRSWHRGAVRDVAYWSPSFPEGGEGQFRGTLGEATEAVRTALFDATALRMLRADVPVGSYLSGGLDSSYITALGKDAKGSGFRTFSLRFEDGEYDETPYQRLMSEQLGTEHRDVQVSRADIASHFADVVWFAERPLLRTAPAPLFLLSKLVRESGTKVVLTGEGADEVFAGYDLFREGKVRRFWSRRPHSQCRPLLLERLYPYLQRSPVSQRAMSRQFFGRGLELAGKPGFAHGPRWGSASALQRLFAPGFRDPTDVIARLVDRLPPAFHRWTPLAQDQYLEMRTLLSGYLLSSQGDRMLMGNSVEGRFPFLDKNVVQLASTLPDAFKLKVLDEKHVLKRAAAGRVDPKILERTKQPYRAPDGVAFSGERLPEELTLAMGAAAVKDAGVFEPQGVERLWAKCRANSGEPLSNADNMAVVGVLSTQLLHARLIRALPAPAKVSFKTVVER